MSSTNSTKHVVPFDAVNIKRDITCTYTYITFTYTYVCDSYTATAINESSAGVHDIWGTLKSNYFLLSLAEVADMAIAKAFDSLGKVPKAVNKKNMFVTIGDTNEYQINEIQSYFLAIKKS